MRSLKEKGRHSSIFDKTADEIEEWCRRKANSFSFSDIAISRMIFNCVVDDGVVDEKDESTIRETFATQQNVWNVVLLVDALVTGMVLPFVIGSPGSEDELLFDVYMAVMAFTFFFCLCHFALTAIIYIFSSYLQDFRDILWFFVEFSSLISVLNVSLLVSMISLSIGATLGSISSFGSRSSIPAVVMCALTIVGCLIAYLVFIKKPFVMRFRFALKTMQDSREWVAKDADGYDANTEPEASSPKHSSTLGSIRTAEVQLAELKTRPALPRQGSKSASRNLLARHPSGSAVGGELKAKPALTRRDSKSGSRNYLPRGLSGRPIGGQTFGSLLEEAPVVHAQGDAPESVATMVMALGEMRQGVTELRDSISEFRSELASWRNLSRRRKGHGSQSDGSTRSFSRTSSRSRSRVPTPTSNEAEGDLIPSIGHVFRT